MGAMSPPKRNGYLGLSVFLISSLCITGELFAPPCQIEFCPIEFLVSPPVDPEGKVRPLGPAEIDYLVLLQEEWAWESAGVDATEAAKAMSILSQASAASAPAATVGAEVPLDALPTESVTRD